MKIVKFADKKTSISLYNIWLPKCVKTHLRASRIFKKFPGVIPPLQGRGGERMGGRKGRGRITKGKWRGGEREGGRERVGEGSEGRLNNILPPGAWDEVAPLDILVTILKISIILPLILLNYQFWKL